MNFHVAHAGYRVKVRDGLLLDDQGEEAAGLYDWKNHVVLLAGPKQMPVQRRAETLAHELWHLWKLKFGATADEESEANQIASFAIWFLHELERNGGEGALMRLTPEGMVDKAADVGEPFSRWEPRCPKCNGYLELPIRTSAPRFDSGLRRLVVDRSGACEHCQHEWSWPESCTTAGTPTGNPLGGPVKALAAAVS